MAEAIRETKESYSMAQSFKTVEFQQSSSGYSAASNKRPSSLASQEGTARNAFENMLNLYEIKLIQSAKGLSGDEKSSLECIHILGEFTSKSEVETLAEASDCPAITTQCNPADLFRTIDGSCNNLEAPTQGMADQPFRRLLPAYYEDGIEIPKGRLQAEGCLNDFCIGAFDPPSPSARLVSSTVVRNVLDATEAPFTHMVMQWGQFLDHDLGLAPEIEHEESPLCESCEFEDDCEPIRIPENDAVFGDGKGSTVDGKCLHFRRSIGACSGSLLTPRQQLNDLTSYLDGSQIYGSSKEVADRIRLFRKGLMKITRRDGGDYLPRSQKEEDCRPQEKCFVAGDVRANEQVALTTMHTLFLREHNRIAKSLKRINNMWDDERLYQETRKIIGAVLQKITYEDYLTKVIGPNVINTVIPAYNGYDSCANAAIPNVFAAAAYRYGHSLVNPEFDRYTSNQYEKGPNNPVNLRESFFNINQFEKTGLAAVLRGLVTQASLRNDEFMNSVMTTQLFQRDGGPGMDLAALNIQRGRDHGLPVYGSWIGFCQNLFETLPVPKIQRQITLWRIFGVYGSTEIADLFVAGLAEERLPNSLLGPTFACLFGVTFADLRDGDRFYYENPGVFTPQQLAEIKKVTLSRIICDTTAVNNIQPDAFVNNQQRVACTNAAIATTINLERWRVSDVEVQELTDKEFMDFEPDDLEYQAYSEEDWP